MDGKVALDSLLGELNGGRAEAEELIAAHHKDLEVIASAVSKEPPPEPKVPDIISVLDAQSAAAKVHVDAARAAVAPPVANPNRPYETFKALFDQVCTEPKLPDTMYVTELVAPGVVQVVEGRRFTLGELDGRTTPRAEAIAAALSQAGFKAPITSDIRGEIWLKVLGNLSFNPISALTRATLVDLLAFPLTRDLCIEMMREAEAVAKRLGITLRLPIERRIAGAEKVGAHKTSMLQDVEHGKAIEIEALVGAVVELGRLTGIPTPHIDAVYACAALLAKTVTST